MLKHEELIFADGYTLVGKFIEGRAIVRFDEPYKKMIVIPKDLDAFGFIDPSGAVITKDRYEKVWDFYNGVAVVRDYNYLYKVIDLCGNELAQVILSPHFHRLDLQLIAIKSEVGYYYILPAARANPIK